MTVIMCYIRMVSAAVRTMKDAAQPDKSLFTGSMMTASGACEMPYALDIHSTEHSINVRRTMYRVLTLCHRC